MRVTIDGEPVRNLDLSEAAMLDEAAEMAVAALSVSAGPRRTRTIAVRWHDVRIATRRVALGE